MAEKQLITYKPAAELLGMRLSTLYGLVHQKRIPHIRLGRRLVRFDPQQLRKFIDAHRVEPTA